MIDSTETPMRRPVLVQTVNMWQSRWRRLPVWFRRHGIALTIVLLASVIAQAVTLAQTPHIVVDHDGPSYLKAAHAILTQHQFLDATRTPGYPILLALIFGVTGEQNLTAVTYVQAALVVIATLEVYPLVYLIARRGWVACILATLVGTNLYILDWERLVRYETLSYFLLITLFLVLALYARTERMRFLGALTALFVMAILTRPALVLLPGILLVLLTFRSQRMALLRIQWRRLLLSLVVTYGLIGGYMVANEAAFGFFGLGTDTNINLFGKILEYRMQNETNAPQYAQVRADVDQYVRTVSLPGSTGPLSPYEFVLGTWRGPQDYQYGRNGSALLGAYSKDIILHHPIQYALHSIPDVLAGWDAPPTVFYAPYSATPKWMYRLFQLSRVELLAYLLLPVALVLLTMMAWRAPRENGVFVLWVMMIAVTASLIVDAFLGYAEFYRLREPLDWTMIVTVGILVIDALALVYEKVQPALVTRLNGLLGAR